MRNENRYKTGRATSDFRGDTSLNDLEVNKIHFIYGIWEHNVLSQVNPPNTTVISLTLLPPAACRFPKHQGGRVVRLQLSEWCELSPACLNLTISTFATQLKLSFLYPLWKAIWEKKNILKDSECSQPLTQLPHCWEFILRDSSGNRKSSDYLKDIYAGKKKHPSHPKVRE